MASFVGLLPVLAACHILLVVYWRIKVIDWFSFWWFFKLLPPKQPIRPVKEVSGTLWTSRFAPNFIGSERVMFSGQPSGCPYVRCALSVDTYSAWRDLFTSRMDCNNTWHKWPSCKWSLLNRFSRSEVIGQGHIETKCTFAVEASLYFDGRLLLSYRLAAL